MEQGGEIKLELYPEYAPITVQNFVDLANKKFYDGLIFHRVISGFMIQGGGYDKDYQEYLLDFPNDEVRKGFVTLKMSVSSWIKGINRH